MMTVINLVVWKEKDTNVVGYPVYKPSYEGLARAGNHEMCRGVLTPEAAKAACLTHVEKCETCKAKGINEKTLASTKIVIPSIQLSPSLAPVTVIKPKVPLGTPVMPVVSPCPPNAPGPCVPAMPVSLEGGLVYVATPGSKIPDSLKHPK